jgi:hypothetical protein
MGKDRARNDERSRIAHLAARVMIEDGVEDYATAKRKAARLAGIPDTRQLPTNDEIDVELRTHRTLFAGHAHDARLRALRECAADVMCELERFNPYLTGSVLSGNAGKYADINLHLYADSAKGVEMYLIDCGIEYRAGQTRLYCGQEPRIVPKFTIDRDGVEIELLVLAVDDLRHPIRTGADGKSIDRARLAAVRALLEVS